MAGNIRARTKPHARISLAWRLLFVNALTLACGACLAQQAAKPPEGAARGNEPPARAQLPSARDTSESTVLSKQGRPYRILVSSPRTPQPPSGFPVIYVLDGDAWFGVAAQIVRMREYSKLSPTIVVGIGYPGSSFFDAQRRSFDFTPPRSVERDMQEAGIELGGANLFLAFLNETLEPWVREHHPIDPDNQTLFGHSLGGLFVLHAMFVAPQSFNTYLAASPSLGFSDKIVLSGESTFKTNPARLAVRLLVTAGEFEYPHPSPGQIADYRRYYTAHPELIEGQTVQQAIDALFAVREDRGNYDQAQEAQALADRLARSGVAATFAQFSGEEHTSSAVSALNRGVPFALRPAR